MNQVIPANDQLKNGRALKFLKEYWFIIAFIVGLAITWSEMRGQVLANMVLNQEQEVDIKKNSDNINEQEKQYDRDWET